MESAAIRFFAFAASRQEDFEKRLAKTRELPKITHKLRAGPKSPLFASRNLTCIKHLRVADFDATPFSWFCNGR
jgi:hypothetical protein